MLYDTKNICNYCHKDWTEEPELDPEFKFCQEIGFCSSPCFQLYTLGYRTYAHVSA